MTISCSENPRASDAYSLLSPLERGRVDSHASDALHAIFSKLRTETGWCGDASDKNLTVCLPILRELLSKFTTGKK